MDADVPRRLDPDFNVEGTADANTEESSESSAGTLSPEDPDAETSSTNHPSGSGGRSWPFTRSSRQDFNRSESVDSEASGER